MDVNKIHEIKKDLGIKEEALDEFSVVLGNLHSNLKSVIELASLMVSGDQEEGEIDEGYEDEGPKELGEDLFGGVIFEEEGDDFDEDAFQTEESETPLDESPIKSLTDSLKASFDANGLSGVDQALVQLIGESRLNLQSLEPFSVQAEFFIKEYGFIEFVEDKFLSISAALSGPTDKPGPQEKGLEIEPISGPIKRKTFRILDKLNLDQNIYNNMNISQEFFESEDSELTYSERLLKSQEEDDTVTALNFHEVFKRLGEKARGFEIDDSTDPPQLVLAVNNLNIVRETIVSRLQALDDAVDKSKGSLFNIAVEQVDEKIDGYERHRRAFANALDDIVSAIKKRDDYLTALVYDLMKQGFVASDPVARKAYELSRVVRDENSQIFKLLFGLAKSIVFVDVEGDIHQFGYGVDKKFFENYDTRLRDTFEDIFHRQLKNKIKMFFNKKKSGGWSKASFCYYLAGSIRRKTLQEAAYQKGFNIVTTSWNYASCSVCGKNIYTRKRQDAPRGSGRREPVRIQDYSEYQTDIYSLFRKDGSLITNEELRLEDDGATLRVFDTPPTLSAKEEGGGKTWDEIEALVHSGAKGEHIEGTQRRAWALRQLGARKVPTRTGQVSNIKFKCPYTKVLDRPQSLQRLDKGKSDFECGLFLDPTPLLQEGSANVSPASLQAVRAETKDISPNELFELKLDEAVKGGFLEEGRKQEFLAELEKRRGGGWKFSNKYFNCPTRIPASEIAAAVATAGPRSEVEDTTKSALERIIAKEFLKKYSYIASPIAGPASEERLAPIKGNLPQTYPPVNADGSYAELAPGTMSYLVCGSQTSLSSFSRDLNEEGSLPRILKTLMEQAKDDPLLGEKMLNLVETLFSLGVDISDVSPFISNILSPEVAIAELEDSGRLNKISHILALAMAAPVNLEISLSGASFNRMDLLGDIKLVCSHNHKFTIRDSVYFAKTHTGINIRNKRRSRYLLDDIVNSGILTSEGVDNFGRTIKLLSKNGDRYIVPVEESSMFGSEEEIKYNYEEWVGRVDDVGRIIFEDPEKPNAFYSFGSVPKNYIWGSEESYDLSSARQREARDVDTILEIENNSEGALGGSKNDAEGKPTGVDAGTKAAKKNFETSGPSIMGGRSDYGGAEGIIRATTPVGMMLKSFIETIQDWLDISTTLEIRGTLTGRPIPFSKEFMDAEEGPAGSISMSSLAKSMVEIVVRTVEEENEEGQILSEDSLGIINLAISKFETDYLSALENVDVRLLSSIGRPLDERILKNIGSSIMSAIDEYFGATDEGNVAALSAYREFLFEHNTNKIDIENILSLEYAGKDFSSLLEQFKASLIPDLGREGARRILYDPLAVKQKGPGVDKEYYQEGIPQKGEGITDKIAKMKGKHFMARVLSASSALYLADAISYIYNFHMRDSKSREYIGYDIGVDLSSSDKVLALSRGDTGQITVGVDRVTAEKIDDNAQIFYELYFDNIADCVELIKNEMFLLRTACTSSKYMNKAIDYINNHFNELIDKLEASESSADLQRAKDVVNKVLTNEPFTTVDLSPSGKYRKFFGGSGNNKELVPPQDAHSIMPLFGTYLVDYNGGEDYYPIFALTGKGNVYHNFDINIPEPIMVKGLYVLSSKELPNAIELEDIYDRLPEVYQKNGWKIYSVNLGRQKDEYSLAKGSKNEGFKKGISLIYHPATGRVIPDGAEDIIGYRNDEFQFDSSQAIHLGSLAMRDGKDNLFPPSPLDGISDVGIPIPLDYENLDSDKLRASRKLFPVVGSRIPISLPTSVPGVPIELDISDFLMRDPPETALSILRRIGVVYQTYKIDLKQAISGGATTTHQAKIKDRYRKIISGLFSSYRGLPYYIANAKSGTKRERKKSGYKFGDTPEEAVAATTSASDQAYKYSPRVSSYIPLVDWVTMHKMIFGEQFGPNWGGHQLWEEEDGDETVNERKESIEQFIINVHGLDKLSVLIGERLDRARGVERGTTYIDPTDLLNPDERLFKRGVITPQECRDLFDYEIGKDTFTTDDGTPWMRLKPEARRDISSDAGQKMFKHFGRWVKGTNTYYPIGTKDETDSVTGDPHAYIKIMNVIFPSNKLGKDDKMTPRERMKRVRDSESPDILNVKDLYSHSIISGEGTDVQYYPVPKNPDEVKKYLEKLSKVRHISVQRYAEAISEYLIEYITEDLFSSLNKEGVYKFNKIKYSKKLKKDIYRNGIIKNAKLYTLWKFLTN